MAPGDFKSLASTSSATSAPLFLIGFSPRGNECFPIEPLRFPFRLQNLFTPCPDGRWCRRRGRRSARLPAAPSDRPGVEPGLPTTTAGSLIGLIRRECLDHIIVSGEAHLRRILIPIQLTTTPSERIVIEQGCAEQGCADFSSDSTDRNHSFTPDPRRASPSLRPGLSFRYTQENLRQGHRCSHCGK